MFLKEFFGNPIKIDQNQKDRDQSIDLNKNEILWSILDHDSLHKDYIIPIIKTLKDKTLSEEEIIEKFMPVVKKGCQEFYVENELNGKMSKYFPLNMREGLCKDLYEYCRDHRKEFRID